MGDTTMSKVLNFIKARFTEVSSYLGMALIGWAGFDQDEASAIIDFLPHLIGILLMFVPDKGKKVEG